MCCGWEMRWRGGGVLFRLENIGFMAISAALFNAESKHVLCAVARLFTSCSAKIYSRGEKYSRVVLSKYFFYLALT